MAAMTGFPSRSRVGPMGPSPSGRTSPATPPARALRSYPAQKCPPAPVRMATESDGSPSKVRNADESAAAVAASTAFRRSGPIQGDDEDAVLLLGADPHGRSSVAQPRV